MTGVGETVREYLHRLLDRDTCLLVWIHAKRCPGLYYLERRAMSFALRYFTHQVNSMRDVFQSLSQKDLLALLKSHRITLMGK
ncbi:unnamed protein product [Protopolystoma xenopodis]|uniref:Uncharacterized protein n=1 Tax=Protopolystoma xenopodis TaxID=117903 RepID=A0A448WEW5_9PLAT|nr:unnamed protein product [Protopolystoma xenopodis]